MPKSQFYADRVLDDLGIDQLEDLKLLEAIAWKRGAMESDDVRTSEPSPAAPPRRHSPSTL